MGHYRYKTLIKYKPIRRKLIARQKRVIQHQQNSHKNKSKKGGKSEAQPHQQILTNQVTCSLMCLVLIRPTRSETKWKVYCRYISCTVRSAKCAVVLRFKPCPKTLLFKIEVSSKLHLVDLCKGYKLSLIFFFVILIIFA